MTPLAHAIVKERLLPTGKRTFRDQCGLLERMDDVHCFEVSEVRELARDLARSDAQQDLSAEQRTERFAAMTAKTSFLPAPKTWLEWKVGDLRMGHLLIEKAERAEIYSAVTRRQTWGSYPDVLQTGLSAIGGDAIEMVVPKSFGPEDTDAATDTAVTIHGLLALINTPRIIGRRQHMPHRGLERALLAARKTVGKFPLHAWTEIKLEVNRPPEDVSDDPSVEAHLTGQKALHFCRAHLRLRLGRVEIVRSHWRGDAALGVKQSRYTVVPLSSAAA